MLRVPAGMLGAMRPPLTRWLSRIVARIRTIKPEFPQSESVGKLSRDARLLFVQLWTIVDDAGRARAASRMLASLLYPYDDDARMLIDHWLGELEAGEHIRRYEVDGSQYLEIVKWLEHQKIDKPSKSRLPEFVEGSRKLANAREASATDLGPSTLDLGPSNSEASASGAVAPLDPAIPEREYFMRGREVLGKGAGGLIGKLLKAKGGNVALARAAIEQASQKQNPTEYVAAICRGPPAARPATAHQQERQTGREILDDIGKFISGSSSEANPGFLRHDSGDGPEGVRGGIGGNLIELSPTGHRAGS